MGKWTRLDDFCLELAVRVGLFRGAGIGICIGVAIRMFSRFRPWDWQTLRIGPVGILLLFQIPYSCLLK